jgi:hypothetical protein
MNSTINLISTDVNNSTVVVHKDGADFDVPVKNMFDTVLPSSLPSSLNPTNVSNGLGLKFYLFTITNADNFLGVSGVYNNTNLGPLVSEDLNVIDPINYAQGEWGLFASTSISDKIYFTITNATTTANHTIYFAVEPDTYNNFGGKSFIKYVVYNNTGAIVTSPGVLTHLVILIEAQ